MISTPGSRPALNKKFIGHDAQFIGFQSLQESIDTTTSGGRLVFDIFGVLAEFERNLIRERTRDCFNCG
jgi:hypothetical protein